MVCPYRIKDARQSSEKSVECKMTTTYTMVATLDAFYPVRNETNNGYNIVERMCYSVSGSL